MSADDFVMIGLSACVAGVIAYFFGRAGRAPAPPESASERLSILEAARSEADALRRQAELDAEDIRDRAKDRAQKKIQEQKSDVQRQGAELKARRLSLEARETELKAAQTALDGRAADLEKREAAAEALARGADERREAARRQIEKAAQMSASEARAALESQERPAALRAVESEVRRIEEEAWRTAQSRAQLTLATAIQRFASDYVVERTVATVALPSDDIKGRLIGREGRNIRAIEAATGIDLIVDDTPEAVVISCFNPVRREVARIALTKLIADGRIHPTRIEEMVGKAEEAVDLSSREAGERAVFDLNVSGIHPELVMLLGRLKYRSSAAQDLLQHSMEVGYLAGLMAAELGVDTSLARRAGLLHDIGKAAEQDVEGSHARAGAALARKFGESPAVVSAIEAHHGRVGESDSVSVLDHLVEAANALSGQRPGARKENLGAFVQRLEDLETIATSFDGVTRAFAIQAGREVRVLVDNASVTDSEVRSLSRSIAKKVEESLSFPGHIRVSVIRDTRATEYAG